jgi:hypothetical protein
MNLAAKGMVKEITIEAVVTRADGTIENLGVIASSKKGNIISNLLKKKSKKKAR